MILAPPGAGCSIWPPPPRARPPPLAPDDRTSLIPPGFPRRALIALLLVALVLRVGTSLSRVDEYFQEGLVRGVLAQAWVDGAPVWKSQAPQLPHIRGSVVMSAIAVPSFAVFGPSVFAVRIGGILFHLAGLVTLMLLMHRQFGPRASTLAGLLFVFCVPSLAKIAILSYGDHIESLPFIFATAWLALAWCDDRSGRRAGLAFAVGLVAGLGIDWHAQSRMGVAAVALLCAIVAPLKPLRRDFWIGFVPGLALGLVPLVLGDWITARQGLLVQGTDPVGLVSGKQDQSVLAKWLDFWFDELSHAAQIPWRPAAVGLIVLAVGCGVGLLVATARAIRAGRLTLRDAALRGGFLLAYPLVFSAVFAASRFVIFHELDNAVQVRYLLPVLPVVLLPIAVAGARLFEGGRRALAVALLVPPMVLGAWGSLSTWDLDTIRHEPARSAVVWESFNEHLLYGSLTDAERAELRALELSLYGHPTQDDRVRAWLADHADPAQQLALVERFDNQAAWTRPLRFLQLMPLGGLMQAPSPEVLTKRLEALPENLRLFAGAQVARTLGAEPKLRPGFIAALLRSGTPREQQVMLRALGQGLMRYTLPRFFKGKELKARLALLPEIGDRRELAFGSGAWIGTLVSEYYPAGDLMLREYLKTVDSSLHAAFVRGVGAGYRWRFLVPPDAGTSSPAIARLIARLPPRNEKDFRAGLGGADTAF